MKDNFTYLKILNKHNFKESFSNLNIIYELMLLARDEVEFHSEIKNVVQSKFLEEIQLEMLRTSGDSYLFDYKTNQELPVIWNALNDSFQLSEDYYDFKVKVESSIKAVILILNRKK